MVEILPWLFWCISAAMSTLASADFLLLDRQKRRISDRATDFWDWLDDQRELKYLPRLRKFGWQRFVVMLYAVLALVASIVLGCLALTGPLGAIEDGSKLSLHYLLGMYIGSFLTALFMARSLLPRVLNWVTKTQGSWAYIGRSTAAAVATIIFYCAIWTVDRFWLGTLLFNAEASFTNPVTTVLFGACAMSVATFVFVMLLSWMLVVVPVFFVLLLMVLFRAVQVVAVRVAENPKGPQYAVSALLAAIGAAVSHFTRLIVA